MIYYVPELMQRMPVYLLKQGTIETNSDGEVVGVSRAYIHLLGKDITYVVRRKEARGIRREPSVADAYQEAGLSSVQTPKSRFRQYGKNVL
jgi:hypothetical protein